MNIDENELQELYAEGRRDFHGCDLRDADLTEIDLSFANLSGANLSNANLNYSNLSYTNLINAKLRGASLIGANLKWSDIIYADLRDANLEGADLEWANLRSAKLTNAKYQTVKNIERADITDAIGVEKVIEKIEKSDIQLNLFAEYPIKHINRTLKCEPKSQDSSQEKYPPASLPKISRHTKMQGILAEIGQTASLPKISRHTKMQGILAEIGQKLGYRVWIARNDHSKDYRFGEYRFGDDSFEDSRFGKLKELTMEGFSIGGLEKQVEKISKLIDVIWLNEKDQFKVVALFEIECTTTIHSGLLRMGDFVANVKLNPLTFIDPTFPMYIVIPEKRKKNLQSQLSRPIFQYLELHKSCEGINIEDIERCWENIIKQKIKIQQEIKPNIIDLIALSNCI
ncbi:pentapeptide repeat-containing protein [Microcoleus sp. N9_B2]|uniref:pentapeptide repeat-containing protein n=1 Tax=unclassified Microcoleus TaxID=2642155 RepID=UPI002FD08485